MRSGLIDGMETWTTACTAFNLAPVVSHYVGLNFIPGVEHTAIRTQTVDKLGSALAEQLFERSAERRVGKECVSTCSSRWSPYPSKKNNTHNSSHTPLRKNQ